MEQQTLRSTLHSILKSKSEDSPTYRKALTIYDSILQSAKDIPNFEANYANSNPSFALFIFGSVYKLLIKNDVTMKHNTDSMLMLINQTLPYLNAGALKINDLLGQLQNTIFNILTGPSEDKTPLLIRHAISILSFTLINTENIEKNQQATKILCEMFQYAVESHRTNILSKQASKMLTHLIQDNANLAKIISRHASNTLLGNLDSNLYLNNVREVIAEFPYQQINDIGYRVTKHLANVECSSEADETYLAQTYFFLEKLVQKFSSSTLEEICKELLANVPASASSDSKVIFCYVQTLHAVFEALTLMNQKISNKYISTVLSILQEFMVKGGRIEKQSVGIMKSIMTNCIRKSLWVNANEQDFFNFQGMGLQEEGKNNFSKVVCMLQAMLSDQFKNHKATATIIEAFFGSLDQSALESTLELIDRIVGFRDTFEDKSFKNVMQAVFSAMGVQKICQIYRIGVEGDIGSSQFQNNNNLWLLHCTEKYEGKEQYTTFGKYFHPILGQLKNILANPHLTPVRKDAYNSLKEMTWRCLKVFCRKPKSNYKYEPLIQSIKQEMEGVSDSTLQHIAMALESLCSNLYKQQYECKWASNLIGMLAKILVLEKNNSKQILRAIKYLSTICEKQYLNRVFDKNIVKLLQEKEKGTITSQEALPTNLKNMEILIAVSNGINFFDPTVINPYRVSREQLVIKLIGELISDINFFQKKAYKYILETLPLMGKGYLTEVVDLLQAHHHKILAASKHYRLAILMYLWKQLNQSDETINQAFEFIKKYLPQIMVDLRESNQRARKQASALFDSFCHKLEEMGLIQNFLEIMCAGLATDSVQMKVATLNGITIIYTKKLEVDLEFSLGILEIVLFLLYERKHQIYKAIVQFCRRFVFGIDTTKNHTQVLSTILEQLFKVDIQSKMEHRSILKHFLLKLTKKFGRQAIERLIPVDDRKILSNAIKTQNREKRKKREKQQQKRMYAEKARKQAQMDDDSNEEQQREQGEGMDEENMVEEEQLQELQNPDNLLLKYDLEKENFHFEEQKIQIKSNLKKARQEKREEGDDVTFGENGIMIVKEDPRRAREVKEDDYEGQEGNQAPAYLNVKKRRKLNDIHQIKESGSTFRSKRAGGDVKMKDKPQPYAFIQFNSKALNKRFKKRAETAFDQIFQRKQGGLKGIKSKIAITGNH